MVTHKIVAISRVSLVVAFGGVFASAFASDGYLSVGWGTKSKGMAGAGIALPQDSLCVAQNPAGIAWLGNRFDGSLNIFSPRRKFSVDSAGGFWGGAQTIKSRFEYFLVPGLGVNLVQPDNAALGFAVYGNGGMNTTYPDDANGGYGVFADGRAGVNLSQLYLAATYAKKFDEKYSAGLSLLYAYQMFEANGLSNFSGMVPHSAPYNLTNMGMDYSTGFGVRLGFQGQVTDKLTVAAAWQPKIKMSRFDKYSDLFPDGGNFDIPETMGVGVAYKLTPKSELAFDIKQINYSDVTSVGNPFSNMSNGLGTPNGPGFGWRDMTVYKLGYQWQADESTAYRLGVSYGRQPIRSSEVLFNILAPGVQEWHFGLGMSKKLNDTSELSVAFVYSPSKTVSGTNPMVPTQTIDLEMHQYELEVGYTKKF